LCRFIPAVTYAGERLQIYGPRIQCGLFGSGRIRVAAVGTYRIGVYEEDDSPFLEGMGDREDTFTAGLALQVEVGGGLDLAASYQHDLLGRTEGGNARLAVDKSFHFGVFSFSPEVALDWLSPELSNHDFGVPPEAATPERPAHDLDGVLNAEVGIDARVEISRDWLLAASIAVERLDREINDSPIVDDGHIFKGFAVLSYVF
jgi:outer membrane protein